MKLLFEKQVKAGDRIEQAVFKKYEEKIETGVVEELDSSESGSNGFGSTKKERD